MTSVILRMQESIHDNDEEIMVPLVDIVILAAGLGKRMYSNVPKVLHKLAGKTLLEHVIGVSKTLSPQQIYVVYGIGGESIPELLAHEPIHWIKQEKPLGTAHALMQALPKLNTQHD